MNDRARVSRKLEKCNARFLPQAPIQQKRCVNGRGKYRRRQSLCPVVRVRKFACADLKMYLKARIAKFDISILQRQLQLIAPLDVDHAVIAVQLCDDAIDLVISRLRREVFFAKVGVLDRRQDAGHHRCNIEF